MMQIIPHTKFKAGYEIVVLAHLGQTTILFFGKDQEDRNTQETVTVCTIDGLLVVTHDIRPGLRKEKNEGLEPLAQEATGEGVSHAQAGADDPRRPDATDGNGAEVVGRDPAHTEDRGAADAADRGSGEEGVREPADGAAALGTARISSGVSRLAAFIAKTLNQESTQLLDRPLDQHTRNTIEMLTAIALRKGMEEQGFVVSGRQFRVEGETTGPDRYLFTIIPTSQEAKNYLIWLRDTHPDLFAEPRARVPEE